MNLLWVMVGGALQLSVCWSLDHTWDWVTKFRSTKIKVGTPTQSTASRPKPLAEQPHPSPLHPSPMVDPISIATAAAGLVGVCVKLSGQLYTFVSKVRNVDESIQTLQFEINSLSLALGSIKLSFEDPLLAEAISNSQARHERRHWQNVRHSLDHCLNTLTRLDGILGNVENCEGQFLVNVRKRIRLDMKSGEMLLLKEQIASCRRTLQLSLQLITV